MLTFLMIPDFNHHSIVWDWQALRAGPMLFYRAKVVVPYLIFYRFPFLVFQLSEYVSCGSLSPGRALATFFNTSNDKYI